MSLPKHRARAVESLAHHLCTTDYTDGFCCPRDGLCHIRAVAGKRLTYKALIA